MVNDDLPTSRFMVSPRVASAGEVITALRYVFARKPKQTTWVHCPNCRFELVKGGEFWGHTIDGWVEYKCANCGRFSDWDFDAPVPLLVSALHDGFADSKLSGSDVKE